ncbi:rhodanese-like domain-containing protein [Thiomicrorhabdus sp. Kp2]|uniref:rhodanese-like domain-containing protein n=1 Tax=Thiomicrorhabdus sp. Kp2 TaxID=1123518 RepID=UPI0004163208|nr:rhodanese-like domain-containing protein [Thiomicrorhabdus sp. Kp2]
MKSKLLISALLLFSFFSHAFAQEKQENLRIMSEATEDTSYTVQLNGKPFVITRQMTSCAKNKGWLQPVIPVEGVHPIAEIEVLKSMNDAEFILLDMRAQDHYVEGTIPGAKNIPYTEVSMRLNEMGCEKSEGKWNCEKAKKVVAFCNGPVCPQSPIAMKASVREGFPAENFYYYRGGMLDWAALGFPIVEPDF